jgi:hemolysin activation/secretion protein
MSQALTLRPALLAALLLGAAASAALADTPPEPEKAAAPAAPEQRFEIDELRIIGNTVLTEAEIDQAIYEFVGPNKTIKDVEKARAALEAAYAAKGYPTVSAEIPVQRVENGVVLLKVTERTVGRLAVRGSRYFDLGQIKERAPALAEGKIPNIKEVRRNIIALNQLPDRTVTPALRAGAAPDTVDVDLNVEDHFPGHATLEVNNRYTQDTTHLRLSGSLSYDNLWQRGDSASIAYQVAPENTADASVLSASYVFHVPETDLSLLASYLHSDSNVSTLGSTNVIGKGDIVGLRVVVPLGYDEGFVHTLSVGADYKHFINDTALGASKSSAPVTYYPFTLSYQATWSDLLSETNLIASAVFAVGSLGSNQAQFDISRHDAMPGFGYVRGDISRRQTLPYDAQLYAHAEFFLAPDPLIPNEQFSLGGLDTVRGYLESEALGDYGAALQTELRSPSLTDYIGESPIDSLRALTFFDVGATSIHDPLPQQRSSYTLASTGVGVRIGMFGYLNGELIAAFPLQATTATGAGKSRILFRAYSQF